MTALKQRLVLWVPTLSLVVGVIVALYLQPSHLPPYEGERINDRYAREAVKSYEAFNVGITSHVLIMVRLKTGEQFPIICREEAKGIEKIPQSVFVRLRKEGWEIMCEPKTGAAHILVMLELSRVGGSLSMGGRRLERMDANPRLL